MKIRLLYLEDREEDFELVSFALNKSDFKFSIVWAKNRIDFSRAIEKPLFDAILSDHSLPDFSSEEAFEMMNGHNIDLPFILVTSTVSDEFAVRMMKKGIADYLLKDRLERLPAAIVNAIDKHVSTKKQLDLSVQLERNERMYRSFIENISDAIIWVDSKGELLYQSPSVQRITDYEMHENLGKSAFDFIHPDDRGDAQAFFMSVISKTNETANKEYRIQKKDGSYIWIEGYIKSVDVDNKTSFVINYRDVTERRESQKQLEQAYDRIKFHLENAPLGFIEWDSQGYVKAWSKHAERILEWEAKDWINTGKKVFELIHPDEMERVRARFYNYRASSADKVILLNRNVTKSGKTIWCEWHNTLMRDHLGRFQFALSLFQDVSDRVEIEAKLTKTLKEISHYQFALDASSLVSITDESGVIKYVNENYCRVSQYSVHELIGSTHRMVNSGYHPKEFFKDLWLTLKAGNIWKGAIKNKTKYGTEFWVETTIVPKLDLENASVSFTAIMTDITDRKNTERSLLELWDRFQLAAEAARVGIWDIDLVTGKVVWDEEMFRLHGTPELQFTNPKHVFRKCVHPDDWTSVINVIRSLKAGDERIDLEYRVKWSNGSTHYLQGSATRKMDAKEKAIRIVGTCWDITDRKTAALKNEELAHDLRLADKVNMASIQNEPLDTLLQLTFESVNEIRPLQVGTVYLSLDRKTALKRTHVYVRDSLKMNLFDSHGITDTNSIPSAMDVTKLEEVMRSGKIKLLNTSEEIEKLHKHPKPKDKPKSESLKHNLGVKSMLLVPLLSDHGSIGIVVLSYDEDLEVNTALRIKRFTNGITAAIVKASAEMNARKQAELMKNVMDSIPAALYVLNSEFKYELMTSKTIAFEGQHDKFIGKSDQQLAELGVLTAESATTRMKYYKEAVRKKRIVTWTEDVEQEGNQVSIYWNVYPIFKEKQLLHLIVYGVDVTELIGARKQLAEENLTTKKYQSMLLSSQLNPHFIFNALASIQYYVLDHDLELALDFLSEFSQLMRTVLENSRKNYITLEHELMFLKLYVNLERKRFSGKFDYQISVDETIDIKDTYIPPMLLQPYLENTIVHGLANKKGRGKVRLMFHRDGQKINAIIEDNGIGRKKALELRALRSGGNHRPRAMGITMDRLSLLNEIEQNAFSVTITDLVNRKGDPMGTRVNIVIPDDLVRH